MLLYSHVSFLLQADVHPEAVQERLGRSSIGVTLDTYSRVIGGLQEVATERFERVFDREALRILTDAEPSNESVRRQNVGKEGGFQSEPPGTRTLNLLIKSQLLFQLS